jgi:hypothetical protein
MPDSSGTPPARNSRVPSPARSPAPPPDAADDSPSAVADLTTLEALRRAEAGGELVAALNELNGHLRRLTTSPEPDLAPAIAAHLMRLAPAHYDLADDLLHGVDAIDGFTGLGTNRIYYLASRDPPALPIFRLGNIICGRKSAILAWIAEQERRAAPGNEPPPSSPPSPPSPAPKPPKLRYRPGVPRPNNGGPR